MLTESQTAMAAKIAKIMTRADTQRGATEDEAANAMSLALQLLAKHNLSLDDINIDPNKPSIDKTTTRMVWLDELARVNWDRWGLSVGGTAAIVTMSRHFVTRKEKWAGFAKRTYWTGVEHYFVGRPANCEAAIELTKYLLIEVVAMSKVYKRQHKNGDKDFRDGCAQRLRTRAHQLIAEAEKGTLVSNLPAIRNLALVLNDEQTTYVGEWLGDKIKKVAGRQTTRDVNVDAWMAGIAAAEQVDLTAGRKKVS